MAVAGAQSTLRRGMAAPLTTLLLLAMSIAVLAGGFTTFYEWRDTISYRSEAALLFDQTPAVVAAKNPGILTKLSVLRIKYAGFATTGAFATLVADQSGYPAPFVHSALKTAAPSDSFLLLVTASTPRREDAQPVAAAAADNLERYIENEQASAGARRGKSVHVTTVTPARAAQRVVPSHGRAIAYGVVVAVGAFVFLLLMAEIMRRRQRRWLARQTG